jgi:hypothetical protein
MLGAERFALAAEAGVGQAAGEENFVQEFEQRQRVGFVDDEFVAVDEVTFLESERRV